VDVKHLKAAEGLWNYTQECAQFIFIGYSVEQYQILMLAKQHQKGITLTDAHRLFGRNRRGEWLRAQLKGLVQGGYMTQTGDSYGAIYQFKRE
jgi:hypothetical protein